MRVVVVEDEIRIREGICKLIQKKDTGWEVTGQAENGREGLKLILENKPDLIITDIRMPKMDGIEMLKEAFNHKIKSKVIILSAYSEFSYAQQAIRLGVNEYLIKPIVVGDFFKALKNIESQYEQERKENPESVKSLTQIFTGLILGGLKVDSDLKDYLNSKYNLHDDSMFVEIIIGLDDENENTFLRAKRMIKEIMKEKDGIRYTLLEIPKEKSLLIIVYEYNKMDELERWFQNRVLLGNNMKFPINCGWTHAVGVEQLKNSFQLLLKYMDWNIVLGDKIMISYPKITQIQTVPCMFPIDIENKIKVAICLNQLSEIKNLIFKFNEYFKDGKVYSPKEIKECYIRFWWSTINILKEVGSINYNRLEQQSVLENIINSRSSQELYNITEQLYKKIAAAFNENKDTMTLVVKRAQSMIHEFYQTGITLEEISAKLNITPEYLGTQFYKETGIHFSEYIKNYRINKAKELLIGTTLKQYDVAAKVGYGDPKYFGRVFKECTGLRPAEYRNLHK